MDSGVKHLDAAPSYGQAETAVEAKLPELWERLFVACKMTH